MEKNLYIDASHPDETRIVLKSSNGIEEYEYEDKNKLNFKNNIYLGTVSRVEPSLQAAFINFGREHIKDDDVFHIVNSLFDVAPKVLTEQGKAKNPWPNVDAASGALLYHYGLKEFNFYTVLFSISRSMGMIAQMVWERALGIPITRPKSVTTDWIKENS